MESKVWVASASDSVTLTDRSFKKLKKRGKINGRYDKCKRKHYRRELRMKRESRESGEKRSMGNRKSKMMKKKNERDKVARQAKEYERIVMQGCISGSRRMRSELV